MVPCRIRAAGTTRPHRARDEVAVWRTDSGAQPIVLRGHAGGVNWAAFSPDGRRMITASADRRALILEIESGRTEVFQ